MKKVLAFDFGASGGRAMLCAFDGEKIKLTELHRFSNEPVLLGGTLYWDTLRLFYEIKQGLLKAKHAGGFDSVGINTWGVDFGLLGKDGALLESAVSYRDTRTQGMTEAAFGQIPRDELYMLTGNQIMEINTAFQLLALKENRPQLLENADQLLMTPDLFNYFLTGRAVTEYSMASTTQLADPHKRSWNHSVIRRLGLPERLFTEIVEPGTVVGALSAQICGELGLEPVPVIAVCGHDTQNAVAAVPAQEEDFAFLSCGTWSLLGTELAAPVVSEKSCRLNVTNEGGFGGTTTLLKNITGLWLIQESRRQWQREGREFSYAELEKAALACEPFVSFIDPDAPEFAPPGDIPERIRQYCEKTKQPVPQTEGEVMRCIYQSLAMKYRYALAQISDITGKKYRRLYLVGGGTKDKLLCALTAEYCGVEVSAGPVEATVLGNAAIQLMALGEIPDVKTARKLIGKSESVRQYPAGENPAAQTAYQRFLAVAKPD